MYDDFDRIQSIVDLEGIFLNLGPLRIGLGRETGLEAATDLAVYRIGKETIVIPGSSIKGMLRSFAESILRAQGLDVHDPWEFDKMRAEFQKKDGEIKPCVICGLFGSTELASHLTVFDAEPLEKPSPIYKTGISIDRDFAAVRPAVLYQEEFIPPNVRWRLHIRLTNVSFPPDGKDGRAALLSQVLKTWKDLGLQIGARKSVGAGLTRLEKCHWKRYTVKNGSITLESEGDI